MRIKKIKDLIIEKKLPLYAKRYSLNAIKALTLFEFVVTLTIIIIFLAVFAAFISRLELTAKEVGLELELKTLRQVLVLYKALKGKNPDTLKELMRAEHKPQGLDSIIFGKEFLSTVGRDKAGNPLDPFGKEFKYDKEKGVVYSQERGYENW